MAVTDRQNRQTRVRSIFLSDWVVYITHTLTQLFTRVRPYRKPLTVSEPLPALTGRSLRDRNKQMYPQGGRCVGIAYTRERGGDRERGGVREAGGHQPAARPALVLKSNRPTCRRSVHTHTQPTASRPSHAHTHTHTHTDTYPATKKKSWLILSSSQVCARLRRTETTQKTERGRIGIHTPSYRPGKGKNTASLPLSTLPPLSTRRELATNTYSTNSALHALCRRSACLTDKHSLFPQFGYTQPQSTNPSQVLERPVLVGPLRLCQELTEAPQLWESAVGPLVGELLDGGSVWLALVEANEVVEVAVEEAGDELVELGVLVPHILAHRLAER
mmetsp:Transcript_21337/g.52175  ORF Transcript_21337/g.52175 Transcript_21337/m.52175 type:complete len:332 (-) Transcript_21337:1862-2857(-)